MKADHLGKWAHQVGRLGGIGLAFGMIVCGALVGRAAETGAGPALAELEALAKELSVQDGLPFKLVEKHGKRALDYAMAGLKLCPTNHLWGIEAMYAITMNRSPGKLLAARERSEHFGQIRDQLSRATELLRLAIRKHPEARELPLQLTMLLPELAEANLDCGDPAGAIRIAEAQLNENRDTNNWNYGNVIHSANSQLGRAALVAGDRKKAVAYLLAAGATPGSPQLNSFGPDFTLARKLLEAGERDAVLKYLDLVEKFWVDQPRRSNRALAMRIADEHAAELARWRKEINDGRIPFGRKWQ